jgi:hypothetical protein
LHSGIWRLEHAVELRACLQFFSRHAAQAPEKPKLLQVAPVWPPVPEVALAPPAPDVAPAPPVLPVVPLPVVLQAAKASQAPNAKPTPGRVRRVMLKPPMPCSSELHETLCVVRVG